MADKSKTTEKESSLFTTVDTSALKKRSQPRLITHSAVPAGKSVSGKIIAVIESPVSTVKGMLLHVQHANGEEFTFPCTGTVRSALAPGRFDGDNAALLKVLEKEIGKQFVATRLTGDKIVFDVYTATK